MTRKEHMEAFIAEIKPVGFAGDLGLVAIDDPPPRYLFAQINHGRASDAQSHWFTASDDMEALARDWVGDEYREDWEPMVLLDLDTGQKYAPVVGLRFEPQR